MHAALESVKLPPSAWNRWLLMDDASIAQAQLAVTRALLVRLNWQEDISLFAEKPSPHRFHAAIGADMTSDLDATATEPDVSMVEGLVQELENPAALLTVVDPRAAAMHTWADLDGRLAGLAATLPDAASRADLQDVGRCAREVMIDCARFLADPELAPDGHAPLKVADAKAWLDLFLAAWAGCPSRDELRRLVRDASDLARKVTHSDLGRVHAFAVAQKAVP